MKNDKMKNKILGIEAATEDVTDNVKANWLGRGIVWSVYHKNHKTTSILDGLTVAALMNMREKEKAMNGQKEIKSDIFIFSRK